MIPVKCALKVGHVEDTMFTCVLATDCTWKTMLDTMNGKGRCYYIYMKTCQGQSNMMDGRHVTKSIPVDTQCDTDM